MVEQLVARAKEAGTSWVDAEEAFKLHDTYGFPYDLTRELLADAGLSVDDQGFDELMEEQRSRARMGIASAHGSEDRHGKVMSFDVSGKAAWSFEGAKPEVNPRAHQPVWTGDRLLYSVGAKLYCFKPRESPVTK